MDIASTNEDLFLIINRFAQRTPELHNLFKFIASYTIVVFFILLLAGWLYSRRAEINKMVVLAWAGIGTVIAVGINQPFVSYFHEARPYTKLHNILILAHPSSDYSLPSDHSVMAGAVTAGLFLVNPILGLVSLFFALLLGFSRVYTAAHYPGDILAGLALGAIVAFGGYFIVRKPLTHLVNKLINSPLKPLLTTPASKKDHISQEPQK
jgi:membrane-associated phospholipid phosphatase